MTRAAIAAKDRNQREAASKRDYEVRKEANKIAKYKADNEHVTQSANAAANMGKAIAALNHPDWYKKFGSSQYTAQLPVFARIGLETIDSFLSNGNGSTGFSDGNYVLPGICVIEYLSALPNQKDSPSGYVSSPINVGLSRFMSELRKLNSRVGEYDPSDVGLYWYAAADYLYLIERTRIGIKAYNTYHISNAYFCDAILEALGFNAADFKANIAEYKYLVSKHIRMFNSNLVLPSTLTFLLRRAWLATYIAKDHKGDNAQVYIFRQRKVGMLGEDEDIIQYGSDSTVNMVYAYVNSELEGMAQRLADSVGMQVIIADMRAGIPENKQLKLEELDETAELIIDDGTHELEQIHNIKTFPLVMNNSYEFTKPNIYGANIIAMNTGYLAQGSTNDGTTMDSTGPRTEITVGANYITPAKTALKYDNEFLNFYDDKPEADDILEATRLRHVSSLTDNSNDTIFVTSVIKGTEVVSHFTFYVYDKSFTLRTYVGGTDLLYLAGGSQYVAMLNYLSMVSKFDWLPKARIYRAWTESSNHYCGYTTHGEIDQVVPLSEVNLRLLHEQCTLSTFFIESAEFTKR